jgi:hypothetical protein
MQRSVGIPSLGFGRNIRVAAIFIHMHQGENVCTAMVIELSNSIAGGRLPG